MIPLTDEERLSMSISNLVSYAELLNILKQELENMESED